MENRLLFLAGDIIHTSDRDLSAATIASVVITGIAVVFIGLIILIMLVWLYGKIFEKINASADAKKASGQTKEAASVKVAEPIVPQIEDGIEEEVVAVISAAIAAYGAQSGKKLVLRSIKRKTSDAPSGGSNVWRTAGLLDATRPF